MSLGRIFVVIFGVIVGMYLLAANFVFVPYYNWQFAKEHGFMEWLFFGELSATMRAYRWPLLVFSSTKERSASHELAAMMYHNKAVEIAKKYGGVGPAGATGKGNNSEADWRSIMDYNRKALEEAKAADIAEMNKWYPGYGDHFRDEFIGGLRQVIQNSATMSPLTANGYLHGQLLMNNFGDWYTANLEGIRGRKLETQ